jgi:transposase
MRLLYRRCAGLDIHKDSVSVCIRTRVSGKAEAEIIEERFLTFTQELERLAAWLKEHKVRQVAMESTGVYWIPVWNILERPKYGLQLMLVNPAIVRALQGCKTDRIDARRIAEFLHYGLLRGSFIPPKPVRQMRELTDPGRSRTGPLMLDKLSMPLRSGSARARAAGPQPYDQPDRAIAGDGEHQAGFGSFQYRRQER